MKKNVILVVLFSFVTALYAEKAPGTDGAYKNSCHGCKNTNGTLTCDCCEANGDNCAGTKCGKIDDGDGHYIMDCKPYGIYRPTSKSCPSTKYKNNNGKLECE